MKPKILAIIFVTLSVITLIVVFSSESKEGKEKLSVEDRNPKRSKISHRSISSGSDNASLGTRPTSTPRNISEANNQGPEATKSFVLELLSNNEDKGLELLANLETELDYETIGEAIYDHFIQEGRYLDGLAAFETLNKNLTLTTPLLHSFVSEYYRNEPKEALEWVTKNTHLNGIEAAAYSLGEHSSKIEKPEAEVLSMLDPQLPLDVRTSYLNGAMDSWVENDLNGAFKFFSTAELPGFYYDETIYRMTGKAAEVDPSGAMEWAETIINEQFRHSALSEVSARWESAAPEEFEKWLGKQSPKLQGEIQAVRQTEE